MNRVRWIKLTVGAFLAGSAAGQSTNEVRELEPIKVSAMLMEQELKEVPLSVSVMTAEQISQSSASTTAGLMADIPGVETFDTGISGMLRVGIRGEGDRTLVLVDGIRISEQKSMSGAPILISPNEIERIEVVKGPGSVLYGSEAMGGVVNIITKSSASEGVGGGFDINMDSALNGGQMTGRFSYRKGDTRIYATASVSDYDNRESADGEIDNTSWNSASVNAGIAHDSEKKSVGLNFSWFDAEYEIYTGNENMVMDLPKWERTRLNGWYEQRDISPHLAKIRTDVYYQYSVKDFINDIDWGAIMGIPSMLGTWTEYKDTHNEQDTVGAKLQSDWMWGSHYTIVGLDLMHDHLESEDYSETGATGMFMDPPFGLTPGSTDAAPEATRSSAAVFVQDEWSFLEGWTLVPGYRATLSYTENEADAATSTLATNDDNFNGTASLALVNTFIDDVTLRAVLAQGYRLPTLGELYTTSGMAGQYVTGNPDLEEETSVSAEIGARWFTDHITVDLAAFYTEAKDYIDSVEDATVSTGYIWENMDEATTFGGEIYIKYDVFTAAETQLAPYVNMTLMRRKYVDDGESSYYTGYSTVKGRAGVRAEAPVYGNMSGWVDGYVRAASEARTSATDEDPGWATLNLMAGVRFDGGENRYYESIRLQVGLLNLLDKSYTEARNSIAASGRSIYASMGIYF
ncbi:MAG: TonB-dependent receptor [Pontiella sp.]